MTIKELREEIKYVTSLLADQPGCHEAYLADLTGTLANKVNG